LQESYNYMANYSHQLFVSTGFRSRWPFARIVQHPQPVNNSVNTKLPTRNLRLFCRTLDLCVNLQSSSSSFSSSSSILRFRVPMNLKRDVEPLREPASPRDGRRSPLPFRRGEGWGEGSVRISKVLAVSRYSPRIVRVRFCHSSDPSYPTYAHQNSNHPCASRITFSVYTRLGFDILRGGNRLGN